MSITEQLAEALHWILSVPDSKITSPQREKARQALAAYDAAQQAGEQALCDCGKKPADECEKWEPGCHLGTDPEHAKAVRLDLKAGEQPLPVRDELPPLPTLIPLKSDAAISWHKDINGWIFTRGGEFIRHLDEFETEHIEAAMRAALAQSAPEAQQAEPFAYVHKRGTDDEEFIHATAVNAHCHACEPLFLGAHQPAQAVPLSDEQKEVEWKRLLSLSARFTSADWFEAGACFAESHHGIGVKLAGGREEEE